MLTTRSLIVALMIAIVALGAFSNLQIRGIKADHEKVRYAMCQALNDARQRAYTSLINDPAVQAREVGKINRTMTLLECVSQGFKEEF